MLLLLMLAAAAVTATANPTGQRTSPFLLAVVANFNGTGAIYRVDLAEGASTQPRQLAISPSPAGRVFGATYDHVTGRVFYFVLRHSNNDPPRSSIYSVPLAGGASETFVTLTGVSRFLYIVIDSDERALFYSAKTGHQQESVLGRVDMGSGEQTTIIQHSLPIYGIALDTLAKVMYYVQMRENPEDEWDARLDSMHYSGARRHTIWEYWPYLYISLDRPNERLYGSFGRFNRPSQSVRTDGHAPQVDLAGVFSAKYKGTAVYTDAQGNSTLYAAFRNRVKVMPVDGGEASFLPFNFDMYTQRLLDVTIGEA